MASEAKKKQPRRHKTDWAAVERDYRSGKWTSQELGDKYGISRQAVDKQRKAGNWRQDLTEQIKLQTNALLTQRLVDAKVAESSNLVANTVEVAAAANAQILEKQQGRIAELQGMLETGMDVLKQRAEALGDINDALRFTSALGNLASTAKTLNEQERRAHNMDTEESKTESSYEELLRAAKEFEDAGN